MKDNGNNIGVSEKKNLIKLVPNILTVARLFLTVFFLWMIIASPNITENRVMFIDIAFVFFVITGLTDIVDGYIARKYDAVSKFGRIVDPLADKILVCGAFVCFAIIGEPKLFAFSKVQLSILHWASVIILISREVAVTLIRQWAETRGIKFPASAYGKIKMFTQSLGIGTVLVKMGHLDTAVWAYWFTTATYVIMLLSTIISGLEAVVRAWQNRKAQN